MHILPPPTWRLWVATQHWTSKNGYFEKQPTKSRHNKPQPAQQSPAPRHLAAPARSVLSSTYPLLLRMR